MNNKNIPIYLCSQKSFKLLDIDEIKEVANHKIDHQNERLIISPNRIDSETINPENLLIIKEEFDIKELLLIDRIKGIDGVVTITDHVNVSGQNFLRANTPQDNLPQFPDMSKIYNKIDGYKEIIVHTVGPDRFKDTIAKDKVVSETIGLVASVAHYIEIKIFALGLSKPEGILEVI